MSDNGAISMEIVTMNINVPKQRNLFGLKGRSLTKANSNSFP